MIGYVCVGTNDLPRAMQFYDELLAPLGISRIMDFGRGYAWGTTMDKPALAVMIPFDQQPAAPGNGTMSAIAVDSQQKVASTHALALKLGGTDEGAVGPRGPGFYAGYFRDLDGNKLNVFCMGQARTGGRPCGLPLAWRTAWPCKARRGASPDGWQALRPAARLAHRLAVQGQAWGKPGRVAS